MCMNEQVKRVTTSLPLSLELPKTGSHKCFRTSAHGTLARDANFEELLKLAETTLFFQ